MSLDESKKASGLEIKDFNENGWDIFANCVVLFLKFRAKEFFDVE
jgi:hypothetical protein